MSKRLPNFPDQKSRLTNHIQHEADEAVVGCERKQNFIHKHDMLEVIYHALRIVKLHRCFQEVPIERSCE